MNLESNVGKSGFFSKFKRRAMLYALTAGFGLAAIGCQEASGGLLYKEDNNSNHIRGRLN